MSEIDLTVIVTAHAETVVAGPTMRSAEAAIAQVEGAGVSVERLLAFDSPSDGCRAFFAQFPEWETVEFEYRDQGQTRNAAIAEAAGRWVALLDGDDLFSENWLVEAINVLRRAELRKQPVIVHPELNWVFDAGEFVFTKPRQYGVLFSGYWMSVANYYDALCVAPREVWSTHKYPDRAVKEGFAYEDWQWGIETLAAGWRHEVAPDTVVFKRRRDASQTHESRGNSVSIRAIDATAIDRVRDLDAIPASESR